MVTNVVYAAQRLQADKWSGKVKEKHHTPEGLFKGSGEKIAEELKREHGDLKGAMSALNFYRNRGGKNLSAEDKKRLDTAEEKLHKLFGKDKE